MARYVMTLSSPQSTGAGRMAFEFAASMVRKNHEVTVIHGPIPSSITPITPEMQAIGVETVLFPGLARPYPWHSAALAKLISDRQAKGVVAFNQLDRAIALKAAAKLNIPSFIHLGNAHIFRGSWWWRTLKESYYGQTLRSCLRLAICVSPLIQQEMLERFGIGKDRTEVLLNGIDVSRHKPIDNERKLTLRRELGVRDDEIMLINVGRIDEQKGQDILAQALAKMDLAKHRAKMVLIGGASESARGSRVDNFNDRLMAFVASHPQFKERLIFAGWRNDVPALLQAADAYVHSARWEGFPLAPLEAMAASKACIWTDCSGHPEGFIDGVHGWVVPKKNPDALRDAIERMLAQTSEQRAAMGSASRELALSRYDIQKVGARFVEMVEQHTLN